MFFFTNRKCNLSTKVFQRGIYCIDEEEEFLRFLRFSETLWQLKKEMIALIIISYWDIGWGLYERFSEERQDIVLGDMDILEIFNLQLKPSQNIFITYRTFKHDLASYEQKLQASKLETDLWRVYNSLTSKLLEKLDFKIVLAISDLGLLDKYEKKCFLPLLEKAETDENFAIVLNYKSKDWAEYYRPQFLDY